MGHAISQRSTNEQQEVLLNSEKTARSIKNRLSTKQIITDPIVLKFMIFESNIKLFRRMATVVLQLQNEPQSFSRNLSQITHTKLMTKIYNDISQIVPKITIPLREILSTYSDNPSSRSPEDLALYKDLQSQVQAETVILMEDLCKTRLFSASELLKHDLLMKYVVPLCIHGSEPLIRDSTLNLFMYFIEELPRDELAVVGCKYLPYLLAQATREVHHQPFIQCINIVRSLLMRLFGIPEGFLLGDQVEDPVDDPFADPSFVEELKFETTEPTTTISLYRNPTPNMPPQPSTPRSRLANFFAARRSRPGSNRFFPSISYFFTTSASVSASPSPASRALPAPQSPQTPTTPASDTSSPQMPPAGTNSTSSKSSMSSPATSPLATSSSSPSSSVNVSLLDFSTQPLVFSEDGDGHAAAAGTVGTATIAVTDSTGTGTVSTLSFAGFMPETPPPTSTPTSEPDDFPDSPDQTPPMEPPKPPAQQSLDTAPDTGDGPAPFLSFRYNSQRSLSTLSSFFLRPFERIRAAHQQRKRQRQDSASDSPSSLAAPTPSNAGEAADAEPQTPPATTRREGFGFQSLFGFGRLSESATPASPHTLTSPALPSTPSSLTVPSSSATPSSAPKASSASIPLSSPDHPAHGKLVQYFTLLTHIMHVLDEEDISIISQQLSHHPVYPVQAHSHYLLTLDGFRSRLLQLAHMWGIERSSYMAFQKSKV